MTDKWRTASLLGLVALLLLGCRLALDAGVSWDEPLQFAYGDEVLAWFRSGFTDARALSFFNLYLYGGLFDLPAQWLVSTRSIPLGPYELRHVLTALVAVLGIVATWKTAACLAGARGGLLAASMLALTPTYVGHGLFNPKDIPFAVGVALTAYASVRIAIAPAPLSWTHALVAGSSLGAAMGVRSGGMFLLASPVLAAAGSLGIEALERQSGAERAHLGHKALIALGRLGCACVLAWLLMISAWPWAQLAPFTRPFRAASEAAHFGWAGKMLFAGRVVSALDLPRTYLPTWFAITMPETYLVALACALLAAVAALRKRAFELRWAFGVAVLAAFVLVPFAAVLVQRPVLYDAQRHFLFVMPPLAALAGIALSRFWDETSIDRHLRSSMAVALLVLASLTLYDMARLHPYEYVFFNRSFGGLPAAAGRYETDYWGASYREGLNWLVRWLGQNPRPRVRVAGCRFNNQLRYYVRQSPEAAARIEIVERKRAEFFLATTRYNCHKTPGEVVHTVDRQGVALLYVVHQVPTPTPPPK
jgi:hypothetical protein